MVQLVAVMIALLELTVWLEKGPARVRLSPKIPRNIQSSSKRFRVLCHSVFWKIQPSGPPLARWVGVTSCWGWYACTWLQERRRRGERHAWTTTRSSATRQVSRATFSKPRVRSSRPQLGLPCVEWRVRDCASPQLYGAYSDAQPAALLAACPLSCSPQCAVAGARMAPAGRRPLCAHMCCTACVDDAAFLDEVGFGEPWSRAPLAAWC